MPLLSSKSLRAAYRPLPRDYFYHEDVKESADMKKLILYFLTNLIYLKFFIVIYKVYLCDVNLNP